MTTRKRPSAADYLAELGDEQAAEVGRARGKASKSVGKRREAAAPSGKRKKITLYFVEALLEEARSVVLALGAEGREPSNLSTLFNEALERELVRLRKLHNAGEPFPPYKSRLPGGRPRGR